MMEPPEKQAPNEGTPSAYLAASTPRFQRLTSVFFNLLYSMVKNNELPMQAAILILILEDIQIFYFAWDKQFGYGNALPKYLTNIFGPAKALISQSYYSFVVTFAITFALITIAIFFALVCAVFFHKGRFTTIWPLHVLRALTTVLTTIFFLPALEVLIAAVGCVEVYEGKGGYMDLFHEVHCFQSWHVVIFALAAVALVLFVPFTLIVILVYIDPMPLPKGHDEYNAVSKAHGRIDFLYISARIFLVMVFEYLHSDYIVLKQALAFCVLSFITTLYIVYQPFFLARMNQLRTGFLMAGTGSSLVSLIASSTSKNESDGQTAFIVLCCLVLPFFAFGYFLTYFNDQRLRQGVYARIRAKFQAAKVIEIHRTLPEHLSNDLILMIATAKRDQEIQVFQKPEDVEIACRFLIESSNAELVQLAFSIFEEGLRQFPKHIFLRIWFAHYMIVYQEFLEKGSKRKETALIDEVKKKKAPFDIRFFIYTNERIIEQEQKTTDLNASSVLDVTNYVEYQSLESAAKKHHLDALHDVRSFWGFLKQQNGNKDALSYFAQKIHDSSLKAATNYQKLLILYPRSKQIMRLYASFLLHVRNESAQAQTLLNQADELESTRRRSRQQSHPNIRSMEELNKKLAVIDKAGGNSFDKLLTAASVVSVRPFESASREVINVPRIDAVKEEVGSEGSSDMDLAQFNTSPEKPKQSLKSYAQSLTSSSTKDTRQRKAYKASLQQRLQQPVISFKKRLGLISVLLIVFKFICFGLGIFVFQQLNFGYKAIVVFAEPSVQAMRIVRLNRNLIIAANDYDSDDPNVSNFTYHYKQLEVTKEIWSDFASFMASRNPTTDKVLITSYPSEYVNGLLNMSRMDFNINNGVYRNNNVRFFLDNMQVINQMFWDSSGADIDYFKLRAGELYGVLSALLAVSIVAILGSLWLLYMMMVQKTVVIEKKMMKLFSSVPRKYLNRMLNDLEMEIETMAELIDDTDNKKAVIHRPQSSMVPDNGSHILFRFGIRLLVVVIAVSAIFIPPLVSHTQYLTLNRAEYVYTSALASEALVADNTTWISKDHVKALASHRNGWCQAIRANCDVDDGPFQIPVKTSQISLLKDFLIAKLPTIIIRRYINEYISLNQDVYLNGLSMLMEIFTSSVDAFIRNGANNFNDENYHFLRNIVEDINVGTSNMVASLIDQSQVESDGARSAMIVLFIFNLMMSTYFFFVTGKRITNQVLSQMEEIASLLFMLPNDAVLHNKDIKQCIDTGGASLLEDSIQ